MSLKRILFAPLLSTPFLLATTQTAWAQNADDKKLDQIEQELVERAAAQSRLKNEAEARDKELSALQKQMISTAQALQEAETKITGIAEEIIRLEKEEKELAGSLKDQQEDLSDVLGALQSLERSRPPALLVTPDNANNAARAAMLLAEAAPALEGKAAELRQSLEQLSDMRASLENERASYEKTNEEISDRRIVLSELLDKKRKERDVAASLAAAAQKETAALASRAKSLREILERLEHFARAITPRIKPPKPQPAKPNAPGGPASSLTAKAPSPKPPRAKPDFTPSRSFASLKGALKPPVTGEMIGKFGARRPEGGKFDGVRFLTRDKAIVTAPFEADVVFARSWDPIGNLIVLDAGAGYHILLIGVSAFLIEEGQEVAAGEPIGAMSGDQARLDVEIRKNGEPVDPAQWLSRKSNEDFAF